MGIANELKVRPVTNLRHLDGYYVIISPQERDEAVGEIERLRAALQGLIKRHVDLVSSGDCGYWDVETEEAVIAARKALGANEQKAP